SGWAIFLGRPCKLLSKSYCAGRCGEGYSRDATCNCDYNCQHYMECCPDFKKVCTVELSCKGRCFESFARGRECDCDAQCKKYGKCCSDYEKFCEEVHNPTSPPSSKPAPPPPGASQTIKSTTKRSPKSPNKKKTKKVIESEEITEEHSVSENQESSSSSSSSSSTIRKIKSSKNSAANRELQKKPKVKDNKKKRTPKKEPAPKPPATDEAGSGLDSAPAPDIPTTPRSKVTTSPKTTTVKPTNPKPSLPPKPKEKPSTSNKETTVKTKETTETNKQTSTSAKEKTASVKETRTEPVPTTPKVAAPTNPKKPAPTTPKEPVPTTPLTPAPTTTMGAPTTKTPAESTPESSTGPTPKVLENSPKQPAVPTTKTPGVIQSEMITTAKDKNTEKDIHTTPEMTTAATKTEDKTPEAKITSTIRQVTSATTQDTTSFKVTTPKATTLAPKVTTSTKKTTTTEESANKSEVVTPAPKDTATGAKATPSPPKPTKPSKKPTSTKKPTKVPKKPTSTKKPNTPKVKKPKTTPPLPKTTTPTLSELNPASVAEAMLQATRSPTPTRDTETVEAHPKNEGAEEQEKPYVIPRPPGFIPILVPGTEYIVRGPSDGIITNPMLSDETNLCNGKPVDGLTTLRNGTLVAFRGHYFWMLNPFSPPSPPRRITDVWGIPSPIDTVFTRCNCEGKTFFFKDSQYWRFTNDIKDAGYPKQIVKGFGGLTGKIVAALSIAKYKNRPESVYFFKRGGSIQQYTYKQEPVRKCTRRTPINYSVYGETAQIRRRRFERALGPQTHTIRIHYSPVRVAYQDKGFLHNEVKVSTIWRGLPSVVTSAISLPNIRKPDGYDYYAFSKDQYYNIDVPTRTARAITTRSGQTLSKIWYNCP
uniref:SMB domain-containing protein n=1 Tax=Oryctolagus cuniculus TaxID=9986 RepID=G1TFQ7_RABIT